MAVPEATIAEDAEGEAKAEAEAMAGASTVRTTDALVNKILKFSPPFTGLNLDELGGM